MAQIELNDSEWCLVMDALRKKATSDENLAQSFPSMKRILGDQADDVKNLANKIEDSY